MFNSTQNTEEEKPGFSLMAYMTVIAPPQTVETNLQVSPNFDMSKPQIIP